MSKSKEVEKPNRRRFRLWFLGVAGGLILIVAAFAGYAFAYQSRVMLRTTVGGVSVGGLTFSQAQTKLVSHETSFANQQLTLTYQAKEWQLKPSSLDLGFQNTPALSSAYAYGRGGSFLHQLASLISSPFTHRSVTLVASPLDSTGTAYLQKNVQQSIEQPFAETSLDLVPGHVTVNPGVVGKKLNSDLLLSNLADSFASGTSIITLSMNATNPELTAAQAEAARVEANTILASNWTIQAGNQSVTLATSDIIPWLSTPVERDAQGKATALGLVLDTTKLTAYVSGLTNTMQQNPTNAILSFTNGAVTVSQEGKDGVTMDVTQTATALQSALLAANPTTRTVTAIAKVVPPDVSSATLASLGLNQMIGTGTTSFAGSPSNRVANIVKGEQMVNSQVVEPGAEFSTVGALGPIDDAHGYVEGLVILDGQTLPEDGGGLCQVSTTLFRSVLNAGLPVTDRTAHSYEVSYYQRGIGPGLDATIYDPSPDFKWKNDTGHAIYIQGIISGTNLTFELYGTSDGRTSSIDGPHTLSTSEPTGAPIYVNTDTLPKGTTELIDPAIQGAKTTATYTVTRDGQVINTQVFNSSYAAMPAQYLVGTK